MGAGSDRQRRRIGPRRNGVRIMCAKTFSLKSCQFGQLPLTEAHGPAGIEPGLALQRQAHAVFGQKQRRPVAIGHPRRPRQRQGVGPRHLAMPPTEHRADRQCAGAERQQHGKPGAGEPELQVPPGEGSAQLIERMAHIGQVEVPIVAHPLLPPQHGSERRGRDPGHDVLQEEENPGAENGDHRPDHGQLERAAPALGVGHSRRLFPAHVANLHF